MQNDDFSAKSAPGKDFWEAVCSRVRPYVHRTPVMTSSALDSIAGCNIFFKCENLQKIGAFKMRGAVNAALCLPEDELSKGLAIAFAVIAALLVFGVAVSFISDKRKEA